MKIIYPISLSLILFFLLFFRAFSFGQNLVPDNVERAALLALYNETYGENWTRITWEIEDINNYPSTYLQGVGVEDGDITSINLFNANLTGTLPPELGDLTELKSLFLQDNNLEGPVPALASLQKLEYLNLSYNGFSGNFPSWIWSLVNLKALYLSSSGSGGFTGPIPAQISQLSNLNILELRNTDLSMATAIPSTFSQIENLEKLDLTGCQLQVSSLSTGLGGLLNLYNLDLSSNPSLTLNGVFSDIFENLPGLQSLILRNNNIHTVPRSLTELPMLRYLHLGDNLFSDTVKLSGLVDSLKNIPFLQTLLLTSCNINALPSDFGELSTVESLYLNSNPLIPEECDILGEMPSLTSLYVYYCNLTTLPQNLANSQTLAVLNASHNQLSIVPEVIKGIPNLRELALENNGISTLPDWFGSASMGGLERLYLRHNNLVTLPDNFSQMTSLIYLSIANNQLNGTWPANFTGLNKVETLDLRFNDIDVLPDLSTWTSLRNIYLQYNLLKGTVPAFLTNVTSNKAEVNISYNDYNAVESTAHFSGTIGSIYLQGNHFTFEHVLQLKPASGFFGYAPQDTIGQKREISAYLGGTATLTAHIDTATALNSRFQWFRYVDGTNDVPLFATPNHDAKEYSFTATAAHQGNKYYYKIINNAVPGLTLTSRLLTLTVKCGILPDSVAFQTVTYLCAVKFVPVVGYPEGCRTTSYSWGFGDGNTSIEKSPLHAYSSGGSYEVTMEIHYTCGGCVGDTTLTKQVTFSPPQQVLKDSLINVTTDIKSQVLSTTAVTFSDAWPLEYQLDVSGSSFKKGTRGVWRMDGTYVYDAQRKSSAPIDISRDGIFTLERFNWDYAEIEAIPDWIKANDITSYSSYGHELENMDVLGNYSAALYDYGGHLPSANGVNMRQKEMAFTSFEYQGQISSGNWIFGYDPVPDYYTYPVYSAFSHMAIVEASMEQLQNAREVDVMSRGIFPFLFFSYSRYKFIPDNKIVCMQPYPDNPDWTMVVLRKSPFPHVWKGHIKVRNQILPGASPDIDHSMAHSGKSSLKVTADRTFGQGLLTLAPGKSYMVSAWVSVNNPNVIAPDLGDGLGITLAFKDKTETELLNIAFVPAGPVIEGWQQIKGEFIYPGEESVMEVTFKPGSGGVAWYDDLRLHPVEGNMQTYVYDIDNYRLMAILDENNYASFYYYDEEGNLYLVKKETIEGIKTISENISFTKAASQP